MHFNKTNGLKQNFVFSFEEAQNNDILIGTVEGMFYVDKKNTLQDYNNIPRQIYIGFRSILSTNKNEQWFGTASDGLFNLNKNLIQRYNQTNGLTFNSIMCLYNDREGNIWMGTDGSGAFKFLGEQFTSYTKKKVYQKIM